MKNQELIKLRKEIDEIDTSLMSLLDKRAHVAKAIGRAKFREKLPILNKKREEEILVNTMVFSNSGFVNSIFIKILEESKKLQEEIWKLE